MLAPTEAVGDADRRLLVWGVRAAVALGCLEAAAQFASFGLGIGRGALDSSTDGGIFGALTPVLLVGTIGLALLVAATSARLRLPALGCGVFVAGILVTEVADPPHQFLVAVPCALGAFAFLWRLADAGRASGGGLIRIGCVVLALAFTVHALGVRLLSELGQGADTWAYQVKVVTKHGGELAGWTLVAVGLVAVLLSERRRRGVGSRSVAESAGSLYPFG
jgi:hypothetical protein